MPQPSNRFGGLAVHIRTGTSMLYTHVLTPFQLGTRTHAHAHPSAQRHARVRYSTLVLDYRLIHSIIWLLGFVRSYEYAWFIPIKWDVNAIDFIIVKSRVVFYQPHAIDWKCCLIYSYVFSTSVCWHRNILFHSIEARNITIKIYCSNIEMENGLYWIEPIVVVTCSKNSNCNCYWLKL